MRGNYWEYASFDGCEDHASWEACSLRSQNGRIHESIFHNPKRNIMSHSHRRGFVSGVSTAAVMAGIAGPTGFLRPILASELVLPSGAVRFSDDIEPLVQWLETTPREKIVTGLVEKIQSGVPYYHLLASVFLAGIRNVQPRPNVGFKFHTVLVVHAAHQASMAASNRDRWLPLLWAADYFKRAQDDDAKQGDWTMQAPSNVHTMTSAAALRGLEGALDRWDVEASDHFATAAARQCSYGQLLEVFAKYGCRDFRDIGHKAIYVAGAFRLLDTIGREHTEPIVRSLAYALLNHGTGSNPAGLDLAPDRPGKENWEKIHDVSDHWMTNSVVQSHTQLLLDELREDSVKQACESVHQKLTRDMNWRSAYDALFVASSELVLRQNGIVPLHAVTSTNAIHYLFRTVKEERLRYWLLLQNVAFVCLLRDAAKERDKLRAIKIEDLSRETDSTQPELKTIFQNLGSDKDLASRQVHSYLLQTKSPNELFSSARNYVFSKGTDSHDYKFSSAILEDYSNVSPAWRNLYLSGCAQLLHGDSAPDTQLFQRVRALI
jgi:hypothetical protein